MRRTDERRRHDVHDEHFGFSLRNLQSYLLIQLNEQFIFYQLNGPLTSRSKKKQGPSSLKRWKYRLCARWRRGNPARSYLNDTLLALLFTIFVCGTKFYTYHHWKNALYYCSCWRFPISDWSKVCALTVDLVVMLLIGKCYTPLALHGYLCDACTVEATIQPRFVLIFHLRTARDRKPFKLWFYSHHIFWNNKYMFDVLRMIFGCLKDQMY